MTILLCIALLAFPSPAQDDPCADSEHCRERGRCHQDGEACVATSDAGCQQAQVCSEWGRCFVGDGRCEARDDRCAQSLACVERGRCGFHGGACVTEDERKKAKTRPWLLDESAGTLLGVMNAEIPGADVSSLLGSGWSGQAGLGELDAGNVAHGMSRPYRHLAPSDIDCSPDTVRHHDKDPEGHTTTWCALPNGRKKGPELIVYARGGQRVYTEYRLDQEHGEHLITEADGRVMVLGAFEMGRESGEWQSWYIGGGRASRGEFQAGKKAGIWTEWSLDGVESRCDYRDPAVPDLQCVPPEEE